MLGDLGGETHYLWRAVDHEGEVLEVFATKRRDRRAALKCAAFSPDGELTGKRQQDLAIGRLLLRRRLQLLSDLVPFPRTSEVLNPVREH